MSFGWSFGDVISGIKVVWEVYEAVKDGPLNAELEATQFFEEFSLIVQCLDRWERKAQIEQYETLSKLQLQLREQCYNFIKRHILLIQGANPYSTTHRDGRSTWLRKVPFSREQVVLLYQRVQWPLEREEVARLRRKLDWFLSMSTHQAVMDSNDRIKDIWTLQQSNLKLVTSHLEVVSSIKQNLKMVTGPPELGQLDYPMLKQFEHAILPPPPMRAIEATPAVNLLQFRTGSDRFVVASAPSSSSQDVGMLGRNEIVLKERLDNITKRGMSGARGELFNHSDVAQRRFSAVQPVLERLRDIRTGFGDAVGLPMTSEVQSSVLIDVQDALQEELDLWSQLEERIQYDIKRREQLLNRGPPIVPDPIPTSTLPNTSLVSNPSNPIPIPSPRSSPNLSPMSSPSIGFSSSSDGWFGSPDSRIQQGSSPASTFGTPSISLDPTLPVVLQHQRLTVQGAIQSYLKEDGEVYCITTTSHDGLTDIRHSIDRTSSAAKETSMIPFLDNSHVDRTHRFRVQFQGSHILKITRRDSQGSHRFERRPPNIQHNPIYQFNNRRDYLEFQSLVLGKEVGLCVDTKVISSDREPQCRLGTIRILIEPIYRARFILYFRARTRDCPQPAFVEWPTILFKEPSEPRARSSTLTLESNDGKPLSLFRNGLSRRSTQGSVTTIGSFESSTAGFTRLQERSGGNSIRSLVIEFYDAADCHQFWQEFVKRENPFANSGSEA